MFRAALYAQVMWFVLATGYNCLSLITSGHGGQGFAGDFASTSQAMAAVSIFGAVTLLGLLKRVAVYRWLSPLVAVALFIGGVLKHVNLGPETYASYGHWAVAILINIFGTIAFAAGALISFRKP